MLGIFVFTIFLTINSALFIHSKFFRPQTPIPPYPYINEEDVEFRNIHDKIKLSGTLTYSNYTKDQYCVVLAHPSGGNTRDSETEHHKTFLVLADYLTRNNITVLRFDERGIGKSDGDFLEAKILDFTNDVLAGIRYMKSRREFKRCKFGIIGHSKGGMSAMLAANNSKNVEFVVLLGAPTTDLSEVFFKQSELLLRNSKLDPQELTSYLQFYKTAYEIIKKIDNQAELKKELIKESQDLKIKVGEKKLALLLEPWIRDALLFEPDVLLRNINVPVLGMYGSADVHVRPDENLHALLQNLIRGGNENFHLIKFKNLNHLFQKAKTGNFKEFFSIEETMSDEVLREISFWINKLPKNDE